jgi:anaerobic ribonucleoside-triphosphate reductase activating protein
VRAVDDVVLSILETKGIEGVTFTGGEPFAQARSLAAVAERVRAQGLSVFVFTGYELDELTRPEHQALLANCDVVVAGRYVESVRTGSLPWRGSTNQIVHFISARYGPADMQEVPQAEFHIDETGALAVTGFPVDEGLLPILQIDRMAPNSCPEAASAGGIEIATSDRAPTSTRLEVRSLER